MRIKIKGGRCYEGGDREGGRSKRKRYKKGWEGDEVINGLLLRLSSSSSTTAATRIKGREEEAAAKTID